MSSNDFIKIYQEDFLKIPIGTFIIWEKENGELSVGGTILFYSKSGHWKIGIKGKEIFLSLIRDYIYVSKPLFYDYFNDKIDILSDLLIELAKTLEIKEEFLKKAQKLEKQVEKKTKKKKIEIFEKKFSNFISKN